MKQKPLFPSYPRSLSTQARWGKSCLGTGGTTPAILILSHSREGLPWPFFAERSKKYPRGSQGEGAPKIPLPVGFAYSSAL